MYRALSISLASITLAVVSIQPATADTARQPVLFVHGYGGDSRAWGAMMAGFTANGYTDAELFPISYDSTQSNAMTARELDAEVADIQNRTGWETIDIVSYSMGGLPSRYYVKNLGGASAVDDWVSLGGPNHGTRNARLCVDSGCKEMRPGSPFLTQLNSGDETPGLVRYGTWWSPCDTVINPDSSVPLSGASTTKTTCLEHTELPADPTTIMQVLSFVNP